MNAHKLVLKHLGEWNRDHSWVGLLVVVFHGDDVQLPPVLDCPVYKCNSKSPASLHGVLVWEEFKLSA